MKNTMTGKPSIDRPWMQYYPPQLIEGLAIPDSTIYEYLKERCPGEDVVAIHYYGNEITWKTVYEETDSVARALRATGFGEGDSCISAYSAGIYLSSSRCGKNWCINPLS